LDDLKKNQAPPTILRAGLSEQEKRAFARKNNVLRRHLTREQIRQLIAEQLKDTPNWADNRIAGEFGVDGRVPASSNERSNVSAPDQVGRDRISLRRASPRPKIIPMYRESGECRLNRSASEGSDERIFRGPSVKILPRRPEA
jgi:hypothetical protein